MSRNNILETLLNASSDIDNWTDLSSRWVVISNIDMSGLLNTIDMSDIDISNELSNILSYNPSSMFTPTSPVASVGMCPNPYPTYPAIQSLPSDVTLPPIVIPANWPTMIPCGRPACRLANDTKSTVLTYPSNIVVPTNMTLPALPNVTLPVCSGDSPSGISSIDVSDILYSIKYINYFTISIKNKNISTMHTSSLYMVVYLKNIVNDFKNNLFTNNLSEEDKVKILGDINSIYEQLDIYTSFYESQIRLIRPIITTSQLSPSYELRLWETISDDIKEIISVGINNITPYVILTNNDLLNINNIHSLLSNNVNINSSITSSLYMVSLIITNFLTNTNIQIYITQLQTNINNILTYGIDSTYTILSDDDKNEVSNSAYGILSILNKFIIGMNEYLFVLNNPRTTIARTTSAKTNPILPTVKPGPTLGPLPLRTKSSINKASKILGLYTLEFFIYLTILMVLVILGGIYNQNIINFVKVLPNRSKIVLVIVTIGIITSFVLYIKVRQYESN